MEGSIKELTTYKVSWHNRDKGRFFNLVSNIIATDNVEKILTSRGFEGKKITVKPISTITIIL